MDAATGVVVEGPATLNMSGSSINPLTKSQTVSTLDVRGGTVSTGSNSITLNGTLTGLVSGGITGTVSGNVILGGNEQFAAADAGGVSGLTVSAIVSGAFGITKQGVGTVVLAAANTYTGTTTVNEGTLLLQTSSGSAVPGNLIIGDGAGGSGATKGDVVRLNGSSTTQIASTAAVTINNSGLLDLNSKNQTVASLSISGGSVTTETGTLTLAGNVASTAQLSNLTAATISGNLALGATRTFDVQQGNLGGPDMVISAAISGSGFGITKIDNGTLQLSATANAYTGATTVSQGTLQVDGTQTSSTVSIGNGGVLSGTGTTGQVTATAGGTIDPGDLAAGVGNLTGSTAVGTATTVDLSGGGNLTLLINGFTTPGTNYDRLTVNPGSTLGILPPGRNFQL